ncbi:MAG TPA: hypothetical protein VFD92_00115 [Candidatus Binatia bacterium]|nr:hypothetical protein [Candidatus Binatia bacterium]
MQLRISLEQGPALEEPLRALLSAEPYLAYANFPEIARREGALLAFHLQRWRAAARGLGVLVARDERGRPLGAVALEHRAFESAHFDMTMAKTEPAAAIAEEGERVQVLRALYRAACDTLRERGYEHLAAVASTHDRAGCWALQEVGAFHVGTKISWMQPLTGRPSEHRLADGLRFDVHERPSATTIDPALWRRLREWCGEAFDRGPYVFDLSVPYERATAIYRVWTEKAMSGDWADVLVLVRDREEIVAFHSMLRLEDLSQAAGVGILGRGIGATLPQYRGLFTALQRECSALRPLGADFLENETQSSTIQTINVFGKLGHRCLRSIASFHIALRVGAPSRLPA